MHFVALWFALVSTSLAGTPSTVLFQTRVMDGTGGVVDGARDLTFAIYDVPEDGDPLWSESWPQAVIAGGYVAVALGSKTPFPEGLFDDGPRYVGLTVAPSDELSPRTALHSVPFAQTTTRVASASAAPVTCDEDAAGRIYFDSTRLELRGCNGTTWTRLGQSGGVGTAGHPALSCAEILAAFPGSASGTYWIDPDGDASTWAPFEGWCDMTSTGGPWLLCANFIDTSGDDIINSVGSFDWTSTASISGGLWLTGSTTLRSLSDSGTVGCAALGAAMSASTMRLSCAGGATSWDSGSLTYNPAGFGGSRTTVDGVTFDTHGEWAWGGYGTRSWLVTNQASYPYCGGNSCGSNGMAWRDDVTMMEIIGGGGDGCANGCSQGDFYYTGADEGAGCNFTSMRGVSNDRYSLWLK